MARKNLKSMNMKSNVPGKIPGLGLGLGGNLNQIGSGLNAAGGLGLSSGGGFGLNTSGNLANNSGLLSANLADQSVKLDPRLEEQWQEELE